MALESLKRKYRILKYIGYLKWKIRLAVTGKSKTSTKLKNTTVSSDAPKQPETCQSPSMNNEMILRLDPVIEAGYKVPVICDVFIPCHQPTLEFLPESIRSILNQSNAHCIIHVAFDGEFSGQYEVMKQFPEVRFYYSKSKIGPFRIANELTQYCESQFFANQDADDIALPHRIWSGVTMLEKYQYNFLAANMEQFVDYRFSNLEAIEKLMNNPFHKSGVKWKICPQGALINGTLIGRLEVFKQWNGYGDLICSADDDFAVRMHHVNEKIIFLDQTASLRRLHSKSITLSDFRMNSKARIRVNDLITARKHALLAGEVKVTDLGILGSQIEAPLLFKMNHPLSWNNNKTLSVCEGFSLNSTQSNENSFQN